MTQEQGTKMLAEANLTKKQLELLMECLGKDKATVADSIEEMSLTAGQALKLLEFILQVKAEV